MATTKKNPSVKKSTVSGVLPKKKSVPATATKKVTPVPSGPEHKLAEQALKFVDEAASLLRSGIRGSATTTAKSRIAAKKKAHDLLGKASTNLSKAIGDSTSALQDLLKKI
jgi:hypothetical protein